MLSPAGQSWCDAEHLFGTQRFPAIDRALLQGGLELAAAAEGRDAVSACAIRAAAQWLQRMEARRFAGREREARLS